MGNYKMWGLSRFEAAMNNKCLLYFLLTELIFFALVNLFSVTEVI